jgi:hypothetical protein
MPKEPYQITKSANEEAVDKIQESTKRHVRPMLNHQERSPSKTNKNNQFHPTEASELTRLSLRSAT